MFLNGFTVNTAKNLQLDAGILAKNVEDLENFNGTLLDSQKLGATSGGGTLTIVPTMRNLFEDLDGSRGSYVGGNVIDNYEIKLSVTVKEMTKENFHLALSASDETDGLKHTKIKPRLLLKDEDYLDNVCWFGTINGSSEPCIIEIQNVLNTNGFNLTFADKDKGSLALELVANFNLAKAEEVPVNIWLPKPSVR